MSIHVYMIIQESEENLLTEYYCQINYVLVTCNKPELNSLFLIGIKSIFSFRGNVLA